MRGEHVAAVTLAMLVCLDAADGKETELPTKACNDYYAEMLRLCLCMMDDELCVGFIKRLKVPQKCSQAKLSDEKAYYGSCLVKLRRATCATERRGLLDAPQSCKSASFVEPFVDESQGIKNPWGEDALSDKRTLAVHAPPHSKSSETPRTKTDFINPWADSDQHRPSSETAAKGVARQQPYSLPGWEDVVLGSPPPADLRSGCYHPLRLDQDPERHTKQCKACRADHAAPACMEVVLRDGKVSRLTAKVASFDETLSIVEPRWGSNYSEEDTVLFYCRQWKQPRSAALLCLNKPDGRTVVSINTQD